MHSIRSLTAALEHCEHKPGHQNEHPQRSRSFQIPHTRTTRALRRSRCFQAPHPRRKGAPPEIPLNSSPPPMKITSTPGDPPHFEFPTHVQNKHLRRSRTSQALTKLGMKREGVRLGALYKIIVYLTFNPSPTPSCPPKWHGLDSHSFRLHNHNTISYGWPSGTVFFVGRKLDWFQIGSVLGPS